MDKNKKIAISEIFLSIQGEGLRQGEPTIFIRTFGCNLECAYCDTDYAKEGEFKVMTIDDILKEIESFKPYKEVQITGGEPLIQENMSYLVKTLILNGYKVYINTNGSIPIDEIVKLRNIDSTGDLRFMMDYKTPSSGMHGKMLWSNLEQLTEKDQLFFIISDERDYEFAKNVISKIETKPKIIFSPAFPVKGKFNPEWKPKDLVKKVLEDKLKVRISIQLHKIIWSPETRGV